VAVHNQLTIKHNLTIFLLSFIDGLSRGPDDDDAQEIEAGANAIKLTESADAVAAAATGAAESEPDDVRLGCESQPAAQGNEAIPSQPAPTGTSVRAHSASAAKSQAVIDYSLPTCWLFAVAGNK
jgi:hypothetical protein